MTAPLARFCSRLKPLLGRPFAYCDVGARDGLSYRWEPAAAALALVAFEPDAEECRRLAERFPGGSFFDKALHSRSGTVTLRLARSRGCSSILEANDEFLRQFPEPERFDVERTVEVPCVSLDELHAAGKLANLDFLKIDTQGAELEILKGGRGLVRESVLGVEVEVAFSPLYRNQPLFGEVDSFLRAEGLRLEDLRKYYWKPAGAQTLGSPRGTLVFADALYFRPVEDLLSRCAALDAAAARQKLLGAALMAAVYGRPDYAAVLLEKAAGRGQDSLAPVRALVSEFGRGLNLYRRGFFPRLASGFYALYRLFESAEKPWQAAEPALGSRKRFGWFD